MDRLNSTSNHLQFLFTVIFHGLHTFLVFHFYIAVSKMSMSVFFSLFSLSVFDTVFEKQQSASIVGYISSLCIDMTVKELTVPHVNTKIVLQ